MAVGPKISREQLAANDVEQLMLNPVFLRFLSTIRLSAGIETVAYGSAEWHLRFVEGRRSLWCDILRTVEKAQPDALLRILTEEMSASKESQHGRRKYNRLDTDDTDTSGRDPGSGLVYLDYGEPEPGTSPTTG